MFEQWIHIKKLAFLAEFDEALTGWLICQWIWG
jgi:hypothetical protein